MMKLDRRRQESKGETRLGMVRRRLGRSRDATWTCSHIAEESA